MKTYAHTLALHRERLEDLARSKKLLSLRIEQKRMSLLEAKLEQQDKLHRALDPDLYRQLAETRQRMAAYERELVDENIIPHQGAESFIQIGALRRAGASA